MAQTGEVTNEQGQKIGLVTKDRMILDNKGKKLAFVDGQGNLVDAKTNKKMGRIGKDGKSYLDENGELLFTIKDKSDKTCDILDDKGKIVGNVHESMKANACALHCFQAKMANKPDHSKMKHSR
ncbi:5-fold beta-flower protein [Spirosoma sp.]|uniref:5-fold beta-flower protein n=1 Tax=unclassified Spirosoma TaxID=2621999 RepID=UPI0034385E19